MKRKRKKKKKRELLLAIRSIQDLSNLPQTDVIQSGNHEDVDL